jgi:prefoldin subunit 5
MKGVAQIIRLAQHELEERRSDLGSINRAQMETETAIGALDETVTRESGIAMADPAAIASFGAWAGQAAQGRSRLQSRFEELDASAHAARDSLREAAAQMRRLEIALDTERAKARRLSARRADVRADERELARHADNTSLR